MGKIDPADVKRFWDERAVRHADNDGLTNFEEDPELRALKTRLEEVRVAEYLGELAPTTTVVDLGGGTGQWAWKIAPRVASVRVVDYCEPLVVRGRARAAAQGIANVTFTHCAVQDFTSDDPFDVVFLSGLLLYLNDDELAQLLERVRGYTRAGSCVVVRNSTGVPARYEIAKRWSEELQANYAAIYRTREEHIAAFESIGFHHVRDADMFEPGCVLNKFPESRPRIYRFERPLSPR